MSIRLVLALAVVLGACGSDDDDDESGDSFSELTEAFLTSSSFDTDYDSEEVTAADVIEELNGEPFFYSNTPDEVPSDEEAFYDCLDEKLKLVTVTATDTELSFGAEYGVGSCVRLLDSIKSSNSSLKIYASYVCEEGGVSGADGMTLEEIGDDVDDEIDCESDYTYFVQSESVGTTETDTVETISFKATSRNVSVEGGKNLEACEVSYSADNNTYTRSSQCRYEELDETYDSSITIDGETQEGEDESSSLAVSTAGITEVKGEDDTWFTGGTMSYTYSNLDGTLTYSAGDEAPTYSIADEDQEEEDQTTGQLDEDEYYSLTGESQSALLNQAALLKAKLHLKKSLSKSHYMITKKMQTRN